MSIQSASLRGLHQLQKEVCDTCQEKLELGIQQQLLLKLYHLLLGVNEIKIYKMQ